MSLFEKAEQYRENPSIDTFKEFFDEFNKLSDVELYRTPIVDHWNRPIYISTKGVYYVDVNINNDNPSPHSITSDGEPIAPIYKFTILDETLTQTKLNKLLKMRGK